MRKIHLSILALCITASSVFCQTPIPITLSEEHNTRELAIPSFNASELGRFTFTKDETDGNGNVGINIEIENSSNEYLFVLFNKYYGQNELRKQKPRIVFSKIFPGNTIEKVEGIDLSEIRVFPYDEHGLADRDGNICRFPKTIITEGDSKKYTVPIYLAKKKKSLFCNRIELVGKIDINYEIIVERSDKDYDRIKATCDSIDLILRDLDDNKPFCTHPSHRPSYNNQIEPYVQRIASLQNEIEQKLGDRRHPLGEARLKQYKNLKEELERHYEYLTSDYKNDCGQHKKHTCQYCKLSLEQIFRKIDNSYIELSNADATEFEAKKKTLLREANALYKCCTDPTCDKHAAQWKKGGQIKQKIMERYEQLKKL